MLIILVVNKLLVMMIYVGIIFVNVYLDRFVFFLLFGEVNIIIRLLLF